MFAPGSRSFVSTIAIFGPPSIARPRSSRQREATLSSLQARAVLQQTTIRQAKADLDGKTAQAAFAKEDDLRYRQLALTSAGIAAKRGEGVCAG